MLIDDNLIHIIIGYITRYILLLLDILLDIYYYWEYSLRSTIIFSEYCPRLFLSLRVMLLYFLRIFLAYRYILWLI